MLSVFIDDSGTHDNAIVCVLAGFMSTAERWDVFSEEWKSVCLRDPATPDFHMAEAWNIRGEFWGYLQDPTILVDELLARRDGRVEELIEIIKKHVVIAMYAALDMASYRAIVAGNVPKHVDSPYFFLFWHLQFAAAKWCLANGYQDEQIEFTFDDQSTLGTDAAGWHQSVTRGVPADAAKLLAVAPRFAHDKDVLPLKAADVAAWVLHRDANERKRAAEGGTAYTPITPLSQLRTIQVFGSQVDADKMRLLVDLLQGA
jgi:hypothetical protein